MVEAGPLRRALAALAICMTACAHHSPPAVETAQGRDEPALGLYEVTSYEASNPLDLPEKWWERTRYVELERGLPFFNIPKDQTAIVLWAAPSSEGERFLYETDELVGHFEESVFVGPEDRLGRESLLVNGKKVPIELHDQRYRTDTNHEVVVDVVLKLRRVERSPELDRQLQPWTVND